MAKKTTAGAVTWAPAGGWVSVCLARLADESVGEALQAAIIRRRLSFPAVAAPQALV